MPGDSLHRDVRRWDRAACIWRVWVDAVAGLVSREAACGVHKEPEGDVVGVEAVVDRELREGVGRPAAVGVHDVVDDAAGGGRLHKEVVRGRCRGHRREELVENSIL